MIFRNIEKKCKEKGYRISYVEKKAGLGNGAIGKWKTVSPTVEKLQAVAKVLECTVDELLSEKEPAAVQEVM